MHVNKIAKALKQLRSREGLTCAELANLAKVNYNTIIKLESGANKNPTIGTLLALCKVLHCDIEDLLV